MNPPAYSDPAKATHEEPKSLIHTYTIKPKRNKTTRRNETIHTGVTTDPRRDLLHGKSIIYYIYYTKGAE